MRGFIGWLVKSGDKFRYRVVRRKSMKSIEFVIINWNDSEECVVVFFKVE